MSPQAGARNGAPETSKRIAAMLSASRDQARRVYAQSQGRNKDRSQIAEQGVQKRKVKAESAFVSRYGSRIYCKMLECGLSEAENGLRKLQHQKSALKSEATSLRWNIVQAENDVLRREIEFLLAERHVALEQAAEGTKYSGPGSVVDADVLEAEEKQSAVVQKLFSEVQIANSEFWNSLC